MVRRERFVNGGSTTLQNAVTAGATTVDVVSAASFPSEGDFRILINAEVMLVTAVSSNTFTVERGADSTVTATHSASDAVEAILTKDAIRQHIRDIDPWANLRPPFAILDSSGDLLTSTDFTNQNFAQNATKTDVDGNIVLRKDDHTTTSITSLVRTAPSTPYTITAAFDCTMISDFPVSGPFCGLTFRETSSSDLIVLAFQPSFSRSFRIIYYTSDTSSGTVIADAEPTGIGLPFWMRMEDDGTDLTWWLSMDGVHFQFLATEARGTRFTTGPDQIGWSLNNDDGVDANFASLLAWDGE